MGDILLALGLRPSLAHFIDVGNLGYQPGEAAQANLKNAEPTIQLSDQSTRGFDLAIGIMPPAEIALLERRLRMLNQRASVYLKTPLPHPCLKFGSDHLNTHAGVVVLLVFPILFQPTITTKKHR
jgi:hypothetical protein